MNAEQPPPETKSRDGRERVNVILVVTAIVLLLFTIAIPFVVKAQNTMMDSGKEAAGKVQEHQ